MTHLFSWVCHYWHVNLFEVEEFIVYSFWRVLTWDFISGKMKYFHFGFWSISYNCLHETTQNGTHCGCHFIAVILAEMIFFFFFSFPEIKHHVNTTQNEIIGMHMRLFHQNKYDLFSLNKPFLKGPPPIRNFTLFRPQWEVMQTEFLLWWFSGLR